jgi:hypothetical protein
LLNNNLAGTFVVNDITSALASSVLLNFMQMTLLAEILLWGEAMVLIWLGFSRVNQ